MRRLILGTAGHIDHGKTALVRALTGIDTDRLPEEKRRGITIDLGFAQLALPDGTALGIVDVPGHEAFVRNMLAGASGIDLVLLVVAADEGVMPQTREHAAIVELLGVRRGVVALTKSDLADEEWLELVRDDVRALLAPTALAAAPLVPVSARTGAGLTELLAALETVSAAAESRPDDDLFRMPIDRAFTVRGTGTVVTGTVWSGNLRRDAQVRVEPAGFTARVRGLQRHGEACDELRAGDRAAVALAGIDRRDVERGQNLLQGGAWAPAATLTVRLRVLAEAGAPLTHRQRVRVSLGTTEVVARVALAGPAIEPGAEAFAQLRLERPLVSRAGDRFVVRAWSPVHTIAGGIVLEPQASKRKRYPDTVERALADLARGAGHVAAVVTLAGDDAVAVERLPVLTGLTPRQLEAGLADGAVVAEAGTVLPAAALEQCRDAVLQQVAAWHSARPLDDGVDRDALRRTLPGPRAAVFLTAIAQLLADGRLQARGNSLALAGHEPAPSPTHAALLTALLEVYTAAGLQAPELDELPEALRHPDTAALLRHLERQGTLVRLSATRWASAAAVADGITALTTHLPSAQALGIAEFKQVLNLSRKHLIPLLEYLDRVGVTVRAGEARLMASTQSQPFTT